MVKLSIGLIAAIVLALGGYFGFDLYLQHRAERDVEVAFEQIRASGGKASHGKVAVELRSRRVTIDDIAAESADGLGIKIASLALSGVSQRDPARFAADRIEARGIEASGTTGIAGAGRFAYKVPGLVATGVSAPVRPLRAVDTRSPLDLYRFALEHAATVTIASIAIPSVAANVTLPGSPAIEYGYTNLALRDLKDGRIAAMTIERAIFSAAIPYQGASRKIGGEIAAMAALDFDSRGALAALDPAGAKDDTTYRLYRQITLGAYAATFPNGGKMRLSDITIDDVGLRPSSLRLSEFPALIATLPAPGNPINPAQTRLMVGKMADIYESLRIGKFEVRGLVVAGPQGLQGPAGPQDGFALGVVRFDIDRGKIGELALENLDVRTIKDPLQVGHIAFKSLDIAGLLRLVAQFPVDGQVPPPGRLTGLLPLIEGIEIRDVVTPYRGKPDQIRVERASLDWSRFVGPLPGKIRLTAKLSGPIDASDVGLGAMVASGMDRMALSLDVGESWDEAARTLVLDPATFEIAGVTALSARASFGNVSLASMSTNPIQAAVLAAQIETGLIEITLRDLGGVDLAVAQFARAQKLDNETARRVIMERIRIFAAALPMANAATDAVAQATARFFEAPKGTLTFKLRPIDKVPTMQLVDLLKRNPFVALALFRLEVSSSR